MKRIIPLVILQVLLNFTSFAQNPSQLWSVPYEIDFFTAKETSFSSDSRYFAIGDNKGMVTIYNSANGEVYSSYQFHNSKVYSTVFQPNGNLLASSDKDGKIVLYDYVSKKVELSFQAHSETIPSMCFSPDGHKLYSGSHDKTVKIWSVPGGRSIKTIYGFNGKVKAVRVTPDQKILVAGTSAISNGLALCDLISGSMTNLSSANFQKLAISPDGKYAITANLEKFIGVWDINSGMFKNKIQGHEKYVNDVVLSPDGKILISGSNDETVKIWDFEKQTVLSTLPGNKNYVGLALSPNGKYLAVLDEKPLLSIWDVSAYIKVVEPAVIANNPSGALTAAAITKTEESAKTTVAATTLKVTETVPAGAEKSAATGVVTSTASQVNTTAKIESKSSPSGPPGKMKTATGKKIKDIELHEYNVLAIGSQMWMGENLSVSKFRNGQPILQAKTEKEWIDAAQKKQPAWCYYEFNPELGKKYGKLYNWYAVADPREIAPEGWHIPDLSEWVELGNTLGGEKKAAQRLKSPVSGEWTQPYTTDSLSGFNALPAGIASGNPDQGKIFRDIHQKASWWTSNQAYKGEQFAVVYGISETSPEKFTSSSDVKINGLAVRCVKGIPYKCKTVKISDYSEWMQTNLDVKTFRNGDPIPEAKTPEEWARAAREHKPVWCKAPKTKQGDDSYGILYNGYAIYDPRGLAPAGWSLADYSTWSGLFLDMMLKRMGEAESLEALKEEGYMHWDSVLTRKYYGDMFKDQITGDGFDLSLLNGLTNASKLTVLPCGRRLADGKFVEQGQSAFYWVVISNHYGDTSPYALISINPNAIKTEQGEKLTKLVHNSANMGEGYSVRCLKQNGNYILQ